MEKLQAPIIFLHRLNQIHNQGKMKQLQPNKSLKIITVILIISILTIACRITIPTNQVEISPPVIEKLPTVSAALTEALPSISSDEESTIIDLYKRINPSVVNIVIYTIQNGDAIPLGQGSGFVFDTVGDIVTNAHVVQSADDIEVKFSDGTIRAAKLVGADLHSDLAVIKVDDLPTGAQPIPLADINTVNVGQTVVAIGNPFGLDGTLTRGIVSALGRTIPALTSFSIPRAIQTDAPINPGNSGGPLLNLEGQVIGVNAQIETDGENRANSGVGFAIPVSIIQRVVPAIIQDGEFDWAYLGVRGTDLTPLIAQAMNLPIEKGAYITEIISGGPAQEAGLRGSTETSQINGRNVPMGGDVVVAIDGQTINFFDDLLIYIALETSPGQEVLLTVQRDGKQIPIQLQLGTRPDSILIETTPQP
jgi:S1-C subfamily serine protease